MKLTTLGGSRYISTAQCVQLYKQKCMHTKMLRLNTYATSCCELIELMVAVEVLL